MAAHETERGAVTGHEQRVMSMFKTLLALAAAAVVAITSVPGLLAQAPHPRLERRGTATQLIVDGAPYLVLGGELGNSSGEAEYLRRFWPRLKALNLNTLLAPVYWELMEPEEGRFDFSQVDALVRDARANDIRLVLLWFGSWKNSMSCYAPPWVKTNVRRFPRAADASGRNLDILSPFSQANRDADARAFATLMRHVRETDGDRHTVIMVQVENEIGMIPEVRDRGRAAEEAFSRPVPGPLVEHLSRNEERLASGLRAAWTGRGRKKAGTWEEVFGPGRATEELFMSWHFAAYAEAVAAAGKAEYPLPMFANAALIRPGHVAGQYPSGGPLPHLADVWRAAAPSVDFLAPDIYFQNFAEWCRRYVDSGNPLFVPEAQRGIEASVNAFYAVGEHDAIGFAPFGIESIAGPAEALLAESYRCLAGLAPTVMANQGQGKMAGLLSEGPEQRQPRELTLGDYVLRVSYERQLPPSIADGPAPGGQAAATPAGGLVIATGPGEFLFAGIGLTVTFAVPSSGETAGILSVEEGRFEDGRWAHTRWLNGDETHQGRHLRLEPGRFSVQRIRLYRYR
jgi:beta-galactosidase GanA